MKDDFVWAGSAGKRTSCGVLFIVVECSELHCSDGSSLDQNPVLPDVSSKLPTPLK